jgi:hypothetical protein
MRGSAHWIRVYPLQPDALAAAGCVKVLATRLKVGKTALYDTPGTDLF